MKKKLFTLLLCAFAVVSAKAQKIEDGVLYINGSSEAAFEHLSDITDNDGSTVTEIVMTGDFSAGWSSGWLTNAGTDAPSEVATIDMSGATFGEGAWSFVSFNNLETIVWPDPQKGGNITKIPSYAFKNSSIKELTVPSSVKTIETMAFDLNGLETITIPEDSELEIIKYQAFNNCSSIKDVYVYVNKHPGSGTDRDNKTITYFPWCEEQAFPYDITVEQTAIDNENLATLHFPEEDFDFYCGKWKEGMLITHDNLVTFKDGEQVQNGWQQFSTTGSPREVLVKGNLLRTYSDSKNLIAPAGIHVYRATAYQEAADGGTLTLTEITYKKGTADTKYGIPASTGVILKSGNEYVLPNGATTSKFYLSDPADGDSFTSYEWSETAGQNYLYPTLSGGTEISSADWNGKTVLFRNFGFSVANENFVRLKKGKLAANKAYLKLPAEITQSLADVNEGPGLNSSSNAKIAIVFEDADLSQTTSLKNVDEVVKNAHDNNFYTLEGVKVNAPMTKGIYVHNGKKVVIK